MAISGTLCSYHSHPFLRPSTSKVDLSSFLNMGRCISEINPKWPRMQLQSFNTRGHSQRTFGIKESNKLSPNSISHEVENFLLNAINMTFFERLNLAWKIIFPSQTSKKTSNANMAKQRLQMILFSDRCAVSDEAKRMIVNKVVRALSDFVEIESQDKVQLSMSTDSDLGTMYSVTVPVRRVKPEYQENDETGAIANIEYRDTGEDTGSVDVTFDFFIPD